MLNDIAFCYNDAKGNGFLLVDCDIQVDYTWLRTGNAVDAAYANILVSNASGSDYAFVDDEYGLRPAHHTIEYLMAYEDNCN